MGTSFLYKTLWEDGVSVLFPHVRGRENSRKNIKNLEKTIKILFIGRHIC